VSSTGGEGMSDRGSVAIATGRKPTTTHRPWTAPKRQAPRELRRPKPVSCSGPTHRSGTCRPRSSSREALRALQDRSSPFGCDPSGRTPFDGGHPSGLTPPCDPLDGRFGSRRPGLATGSTTSCDPGAGPGPTHPKVTGHLCHSSRMTRSPLCRGLTLRLASSSPSRLRLVLAFRMAPSCARRIRRSRGFFIVNRVIRRISPSSPGSAPSSTSRTQDVHRPARHDGSGGLIAMFERLLTIGQQAV
jgi:hypothetical protein